MSPEVKIHTQEFTNWARREILVCRERGYQTDHQLREHLVRRSKEFDVQNPEKIIFELLNEE